MQPQNPTIKTMERPVTVPEGAIYNEADKEWLFGETNENNQRIGRWDIWHIEGYHWVTIDYRDGTPPYPTQRFHPDGTVAQNGEWYGGDKYIGPLRLIKCDHPTPEYFPPNNGDNVWIAEFDYVDEFIYNAQRYFDREGNAVSSDGAPLPARPDNVPARAHFMRAPYAATNWVMGSVDTRIANYVGEYFEWDLAGNPVAQRLYSTSGRVLEDYRYESGTLSSSYLYDKEDPAKSESFFYYSGMASPVVKIHKLHRNKEKDVTNTYFNKTGQELYSIRREERSPIHKRRYFNGKLICEGHLSPDKGSLPERAVYYASGGSILIDLTNNGDSTGTWRLYDDSTGQTIQQFTVSEELDDHFQLTRWDVFIPSWGGYDVNTARTDWESAVILFNRHYNELNAKLKLHTLEVPVHLQKELDTIDWQTIDTYHSDGGAGLPTGINGMLSEDEAVANIAGNLLWAEIEQQGAVYTSTYKVAEILARMIPHYQHLPAVQLRLGKFLYIILGLNYIHEQADLYTEMIGVIAPLEPMLLQWAASDDADIASMAKYILVYTGKNATEQFLLNEWKNTGYNSTTRGYAIFLLTDFYVIRNQSDKLLTTYATALPTEADPFVRFVMAAQLVLLTRTTAQETWLTELLHALARHESLDEDFGNMAPFIGDFNNVHEYILVVLSNARPDMLEKEIESIIDTLPAMSPLNQVSYLQIIFAVLFDNETALDELTPIRKSTLLAAAAVVTKNPGFVNLMEVFKTYDLPYDAYTLRQLAEG
ncbi:hypothetical protein [Chitinophaga qingshengii]|uniref:Uncharacterized protein n=1 Tax=Chitinophaga qingshengii TaxID=1569794 RepID=A0ABR7TJK9_9BACT|nr:hypothetical protein [Chitinophaga qingshengii]MBC9929244.1 hypothetical protein [Chitinophaga qingshengii]